MCKALRPLFLISDRHPVHRSKKVPKQIAPFEGKLRVFAIPSYSPGLDPAGQPWTHPKSRGVGRRALMGPGPLESAALCGLRPLQKESPSLSASFQTPEVSPCSWIFLNSRPALVCDAIRGRI